MVKSGDKHYITEEILRLVRQSIQDNRGSKAAFCRITGITPYNLSKLLSGNKKFVYGDDWNRLCDYFPEIDDRNMKSRRTPNALNGVTSVAAPDNDAIGCEAVEIFRTALIAKIIMLDMDPVAKDAILKIITTFKRSEK